MEVVKIRGSYRVLDEKGNYARYTEEEYNKLFGNVVTEQPPQVEEQEVLPLDSDPLDDNV